MNALMACRGGFLAVALFSLCINLLMLTVPIYMLQLFDRVLGSGSTDTLLLLTAVRRHINWDKQWADLKEDLACLTSAPMGQIMGIT